MASDHENNGGFQAIQEYFQQKSCKSCLRHFRQEGIELLRQEPGVLVVRVTCQSCGHPLGVAIVGTTPRPAKCPPRHGEWTKADQSRLQTKPRINYDDVLEAHSFIQALEADWMKHLPATRR
ncbi:MAG: hypothetical protein SFY67_04455 [Candidatus Melainabacteria bacterium]|nr:hypothetical protein [Candidatus Melainabacteria bacterium]